MDPRLRGDDGPMGQFLFPVPCFLFPLASLSYCLHAPFGSGFG
jgi:hypothetical protein